MNKINYTNIKKSLSKSIYRLLFPIFIAFKYVILNTIKTINVQKIVYKIHDPDYYIYIDVNDDDMHDVIDISDEMNVNLILIDALSDCKKRLYKTTILTND